MRVSPDGGRTYPRGSEAPIAAAPPAVPATIPVFNHESRTGRMLVADLDTGRARAAGEPDPPGAVARQAGDLVRIVAGLGGTAVTDAGPTGGRHVYIRFAAPLPWEELRGLARALSLRYSALDTGPMSGIRAQIRPPGSRHKTGGWQQLVTSRDTALEAARRGNPEAVWRGLLEEFRDELEAADPVADLAALPDGCLRDEHGDPWLPRPDGRRPLRADLEKIARHGIRGTSWTDCSAARMAVLSSAAMRGWALAEIVAEIRGGRWPGLAGLYSRAREPRRLERLLAWEWRKALADLAGDSPALNWHTSVKTTPRPQGTETGGGPDAGAERGRKEQAREFTRAWAAAAEAAVADPARRARWGKHATAVRQVIHALARAATVAGSETVAFGGRNLALYSALPHRTCARALQVLRADPDPLIELVSPHHLDRADSYRLRVPGSCAEQARWARRHAGRTEALHPVWTVLGGTAAFTWLALDTESQPAGEIARAAHYSPGTVRRALRVLAGHGLAEHGPDGWRRGPSSLGDVARECGAAVLRKEREAAYAEQRRRWHRAIAAWTPPDPPLPRDLDPPPPMEVLFPCLKPSPWYEADVPGPPDAPARAGVNGLLAGTVDAGRAQSS